MTKKLSIINAYINFVIIQVSNSREYQQACEIERLKKENRELKNKNEDLENGKKTLKSKLKIANDYAEDLKKENKIKDY